ncbi:hypothetical protein ANRL1_03282 [Anaerolineae bacterium]|nr:hypothetical protein ANRL1_03282 [Anaerolineae bacterium]
MTELLNNDAFVDWLLIAFVSVLGWTLAFFDKRKLLSVSAPLWLAILTGRPKERKSILYGFPTQMFCLSLFIWMTILVTTVSSHQQRLNLLAVGFLILGFLGTILRIVAERLNSKSRVK